MTGGVGRPGTAGGGRAPGWPGGPGRCGTPGCERSGGGVPGFWAGTDVPGGFGGWFALIAILARGPQRERDDRREDEPRVERLDDRPPDEREPRDDDDREERDEERDPRGARGTLPPSRRASERPIAIAWRRLFTFFPERPLRSCPRFISCIFSSTFSLALRP
jgi:hypothetical protein